MSKNRQDLLYSHSVTSFINKGQWNGLSAFQKNQQTKVSGLILKKLKISKGAFKSNCQIALCGPAGGLDIFRLNA
jgi:hypothetical protein